MKKLLAALVLAIAVGALISAYRNMSKERAKDTESDSPVASESKVLRNSKNGDALSLNANEQSILALKVVTLTSVRHPQEVKGYGQVIDPTPLTSIVAQLVAAQATVEVSQKELDRLNVLSAQENASARDLQTAAAAAQRDQTALYSLHQKLIATWGSTIAAHDNLPKWSESLAAGETALVRIDLPAGEYLKSPPAVARLYTLLDETNGVEAEFVDAAPTVNPQTQGQGFFYLVKSRQPGFAPGASVLGYLKESAEDRAGVIIPRSAVTRFDGKPWVFLKQGDNTFVRKEIALQSPLAEGWFTDEGVKPGEQVVVSGAQMLLSEALKSQIQIGD